MTIFPDTFPSNGLDVSGLFSDQALNGFQLTVLNEDPGNPNEHTELTIKSLAFTPVPEPHSAGFLIGSVVGVLLVTRRRSHQSVVKH